ncbi:hypothetical protein BG011_010102 [Mortierella polycephala]|uniref:UDENN domain-containing protein n=1 Tax=Mortierella polycephala TaxID=41804 RepID=A0A9P6Q7R0_9FUNG|nr:hypothetical protein BG011_010102 [Mortierella polycephala]
MSDDDSIPSIDAIFVARFDTRRGNALEWSNAVPGIRLDGVEYSALPSGLHSSSKDVIYFCLDGCIGVAVFVNEPTDSMEHRGARMVSVGVLVKPSSETGRCGQVWRHVSFLENRARHHVIGDADTSDLSDYFGRHRAPPHVPGPSSPSSSKRDSYRAMNLRRISRSFTLSEPLQATQTTMMGFQGSQEAEDIPASHPSQHFLELVQTMGPAVSVLWKAALLKKRILIYTPPPIEAACLAVYNICLMASVPFGVTSASPIRSSERIQPLFCVGIHDIDVLMAFRGGYVACTTDKLFLFKPQLYDVFVDLSASTVQETYSTHKVAHPKIKVVGMVREEQGLLDVGLHFADRRRYYTLLQHLGRYRRQQEWAHRRLFADTASSATEQDYDASTSFQGSQHPEQCKGGTAAANGFNISDMLRKMITGGWWWWYGDDDADEDDYERLIPNKDAQDSALDTQNEGPSLSGACLQVLQTQAHGNMDTEAIRFFHNCTRTLLSDLGGLISYKATTAIFAETEAGEDGPNQKIAISREDIHLLGLDPSRDSDFVRDLARVLLQTGLRGETV